MTLPGDTALLAKFGFRDQAGFRSALSMPPKERYRKYDFKWRVVLMTKFRGLDSPVSAQLSTFFTEYESYVLAHQSGTAPNIWPKTADEQYEHLFERLLNPWRIVKHPRQLFSIKDPRGNLWFNALDHAELFKAMEICYRESQKSGAQTKPWILKMKATEVSNSYGRSRGGTLWVPADRSLALVLCINIINTWNSHKGDWQPWQVLGSWGTAARKEFSNHLKYGYPPGTHPGGGTSAGISAGLRSALRAANAPNRDVLYGDVANFVFRQGNKGMKQAAFIVAAAFAVGGSGATRIIGSFCDQHGIPKNKLLK